MTTVSIEYRRAPEYRYPAQINDVEAVVVEIMRSAHAELDVDPTKISVAGDSAGESFIKSSFCRTSSSFFAGGNLVAVLTQRLARRASNGEQLPALRGQVLFYPLLQYFDMRTGSYQQYYHEYAGALITFVAFLLSVGFLYRHWLSRPSRHRASVPGVCGRKRDRKYGRSYARQPTHSAWCIRECTCCLFPGFLERALLVFAVCTSLIA